jgi:putative membrane protein
MTGPETRAGERLQDRQEARGQRLSGVFARGIAMGAADIVPGVSVGTIAFITGIYFRLLAAVNAVPVAIFRHLLKGHVRAFWQACDGRFLLSLVAGILCSIVSLASVITLALKSQPVLVWSFFFGLILASVWVRPCCGHCWLGPGRPGGSRRCPPVPLPRRP